MRLVLTAAVAAAVLFAGCSGGSDSAGFQRYESPALGYAILIPDDWEFYQHHDPTNADYFGPAGRRGEAVPSLAVRLMAGQAENLEVTVGAPNTEQGRIAGRPATIFAYGGERPQRYAYVAVGPDVWRIRLLLTVGSREDDFGVFEKAIESFEPPPD